MSMIPKCAQCDNWLDPYGRDGGHSWCRACLDEADAKEARKHTEALKSAIQRRAA